MGRVPCALIFRLCLKKTSHFVTVHYLRQILTDSHNSFTGTFCIQCAITRLLYVSQHTLNASLHYPVKCKLSVGKLQAPVALWCCRGFRGGSRILQGRVSGHPAVDSLLPPGSAPGLTIFRRTIFIPRGSVATHLRCGGILASAIMLFPAVIFGHEPRELSQRRYHRDMTITCVNIGICIIRALCFAMLRRVRNCLCYYYYYYASKTCLIPGSSHDLVDDKHRSLAQCLAST